MKQLFLLRGLPGSGKSTVAKIISGGSGPTHYEADMYFMKNGTYEFDGSKLKNAHEWCKDMVYMDMLKEVPVIAVSNTFTQEWEMEAYYNLAKEQGYAVFSLVVENRHGGVNEHGVPADKLEQMKNRFEIKL
jgi:adenylate kinase family enzyme